MITLRKTIQEDLESLFLFQTNEEGIHMAAFTPEDPHDKAAYMQKWSAIIENPEIRMQTILLDDIIVGSVVHFDMFDETNVSYWIDHSHWGKGIATMALKEFIASTAKRPLYARVAFDNFGSQKVLERCGFNPIDKETNFANGRQMDVEEFVYRLD